MLRVNPDAATVRFTTAEITRTVQAALARGKASRPNLTPARDSPRLVADTTDRPKVRLPELPYCNDD